jgi:hypothetical protein
MSAKVNPAEIVPESKAQALEQVLKSETFSRSDQLRSFLRYICEMEIAGKGREITEYSVGVTALGRPLDFMVAEDTVVRNRAHALRQKLLEYYAVENPQAPVRIDLPKGAYVPRFFRTAPATLMPRYPEKRIRDFALGALAASAALSLAFFAIGSREFVHRADPVLVEAWGPLASADANVMVVVATPPDLLLRSLPAGAQLDTPLNLPAPSEALQYFAGRMQQRSGEEMRMMVSTSQRIGEVLGGVGAIKTLEGFGASYRVIPERIAPMASMRGQNVLLLGDPTLIPTISTYLERGAFAIEYSDSVRDFVIRDRRAPAAQPRIYKPGPRVAGAPRDFPGLLTVLPSEGSPDGRKKTIIFAGASSAGCQAVAEFFCSGQYMRELLARFRTEGIAGFPRAYQVIVKGRTDGLLLLSFTYETHHIIDRSVP